jgi:hypothetical protein
MTLNRWLLEARLLLHRAGPLACGACVVLVASVAALAVLLAMPGRLHREHQAALHALRPPPPAALNLAVPPPNHLDLFTAVLAPPAEKDRQIGILFDLAGKAGLRLGQGKYRFAHPRDGGFDTLKVELPMKGPYRSLWSFSLSALRALPNASLDEVSYRRASVTDAQVEARLIFTLHLAARAPAQLALQGGGK